MKFEDYLLKEEQADREAERRFQKWSSRRRTEATIGKKLRRYRAAIWMLLILAAVLVVLLVLAPETRAAGEPVATAVCIKRSGNDRVVRDPQAAEARAVYLGEFLLTHYCAGACCCGEWADGITATGTKATEGRTIAVDPDVIGYGSKVTVLYPDGRKESYIAEDCGGAIQGNRIDVFMASHDSALTAGRIEGCRVFVEK